jgi:hypothetical protein
MFAEEVRKEGDIERLGGGFRPLGRGAKRQKGERTVDLKAKHGEIVVTS